jgi:invasion protein IalB
MYYSGRINTYKFDRTTVTVGAPRILAMSISPASAGASSYALVAAASSVAAAAGSVLPSATGGWRVICAKSSSMVGAGL